MDNFIAYLCEKLGEIGSGVPDALRIYEYGRSCLISGDAKAAKKAEVLNYVLHNSVIPNQCSLSTSVVFGYGGIGIVLHSDVEVGSGVVIGSNVTLGGGAARGKFWVDHAGRHVYAPRIRDNVYIATGAKVLGGIEVGELSIIGANSVVISNVPPLSVVAGAPAKIIRNITLENCMEYKQIFYTLRNIPDEEYKNLVLSILSEKKVGCNLTDS